MRQLDTSRSDDQLGANLRKLFFMSLTVIVASTAVADTDRVVATLGQPLAANREIILDADIFRCQASTCILASHSSGAGTVDICRALQRKVGPVVAYVVEGKPFDADKLAKCNAHK
jgi:hypothetical protein